MSQGHTERLLIADTDYQAAQEFRTVAEAKVRLRQQTADLYIATDSPLPAHVSMALQRAKRECTELNRICLRHAARRLDASLHAEGKPSEMESAVMLFDITRPVLEGA